MKLLSRDFRFSFPPALQNWLFSTSNYTHNAISKSRKNSTVPLVKNEVQYVGATKVKDGLAPRFASKKLTRIYFAAVPEIVLLWTCQKKITSGSKYLLFILDGKNLDRINPWPSNFKGSILQTFLWKDCPNFLLLENCKFTSNPIIILFLNESSFLTHVLFKKSSISYNLWCFK